MAMRRLLWCLLALLPLGAKGQSCGLEDTLLINPNSTQVFTLSIADYFNNNLADPQQGLCAVELQFVHQFSENLQLWLTSPGGQTIQLIGNNTDDQLAFTFFTRWNITFVPCAETAMPDSGYVAQWNNNQPANFISGGFYDGSYYPFNGCLETFNTGPVNGTWTIQTTNNPSLYSGALLYVRLFFCDSRGVDCCFAEAGSLSAPDLLTCVGDSSLLLQPNPVFTGNGADTSEYGYTYVISREGIIVGYDTLADLRGQPAGNYQVCGLSYRLSEADSLPPPDGQLTLDSLRNNLNSFYPFFCGRLTDDCIDVVIGEPPLPANLTPTICEGESFAVGDSVFTQSGSYAVVLPSFAGCDSLINIDLTVIPTITTQIDTTICQGFSVAVGNNTYSASGSYADTLSAVTGCDSIVRLNLSVIAPVISDITATICPGESYMVGDSLFSTPGTYQVLLRSSLNCDSIVNLQLAVLNVSAQITPPGIINCYNNGVTLDGGGSAPAGAISYLWLDASANQLGASPTLFVDTPGEYRLETTRTQGLLSCVATDTVVVAESRIAPLAVIAPVDTITCASPQVSLDGVASTQGADITYQWSANPGNIPGNTSAPIAVADEAGNYTLIVTNTTNGCSDTAQVTVVDNSDLPLVDAGLAFTLTCNILQDTLAGSAINAQPQYQYQWTGPCISPTPADSLAVASCPGAYYFSVTDPITGCTAVDSVEIAQDIAPPQLLITPPSQLTCADSLVSLNASASAPAATLAFSWSGPGIAGPTDTAVIAVNLPGDYTLIGLNTSNGCTDTTITSVAIDTIAPIADAGPDRAVNCYQPTASLGGAATSTGTGIIYNWTTVEGHFITPTNGPTAQADSSGVYVLFVTNTANGCSDTAFTTVIADLEYPFANAGSDFEIDCRADTVTLDGTGSSTGPNISYSWVGPCIASANDGLTVQVACPGAYTLQVWNLQNGCATLDNVQINLDPAAPVANLPDSTAAVSCITGNVPINTSGTSAGFYQWFFEGQPVAAGSLFFNATQAGTYILQVANLDQSCIDRDSIEVTQDCNPMLTLSPSDTLTCTQTIVNIQAAVQPLGPNYTFQWLTADSTCILSGQGTNQIFVNCGATYTLIATNAALQISDTASVIIYADDNLPEAEAGPHDTITCAMPLATLDGSASDSGPEFIYEWTNFITGEVVGSTPVLNINQPGTYQLEVANTATNCSSIDIAQVRLYDIIPTINFGSSVFPCDRDTFLLQSFVTPVDPNNIFSWSGPGIVGAADSAAVQIDTLGIYTLTVSNPISQCSASASVEVTDQICAPCITTESPEAFTCLTDSVQLQASFCYPCINCTIIWTTSDGILGGDLTSLSPVAFSPGAYTITATDTLGFSTVVDIIVMADNTPPIADAGNDNTLNCQTNAVVLGNNTTSTGPEFTYQWTSATGIAILPDNQLTATVGAADTFFFRVTDTSNGCFSLDTAVVNIDTIAPLAEAGQAQSLTCIQTLLALDGSGSSLGNEFDYQWFSLDNQNCLIGAGTLSPVVSCADTFFLRVSNTINGCASIDSVIVSQAAELPAIPPIPDGLLNCVNADWTLDVPLANTDSLSFEWCALAPLPPNCTPSLSIVVNEPGLYRFRLTNDSTGCSNTRTVEVQRDETIPIAEAGPDDTLRCTIPNLTLSGSAIPGLADTGYEWSAAPGLVIDLADTPMPVVYAPGVYYLEVTHPVSLCTATDSLTIFIDIDAPVADAGADTLLICGVDFLRLNGSAITSGGAAQYAWETVNGFIVADAGQPDPLIDRAGTYVLTVTNPANGCTDTDTVMVVENRLPPSAVVAGIDTLRFDCRTDTISLDAGGSTSANSTPLTYQWTIIGQGQLTGNTSSPLVSSTALGNYRLVVTDTYNACKDTLLFALAGDFLKPAVVLPPTALITCADPEPALQATGSSQGPNFIPIWTNEAGDTLAVNSLAIDANMPGIYTLSIFNTDNGCENSALIQVLLDTISPAAMVIPPTPIDCQEATSRLDGSASSVGPRIRYEWLAGPGSILLSGQNTGVGLAGAPGDYALVVSDIVNGCSDTAFVNVAGISTPIAGADVQVIPPTCFGDTDGSIIVDNVSGGTPPFRYALDGEFFSTVQQYPNLAPGFYVLHISDSRGCLWLDTIQIIEPDEVIVELGPDITIELGDSVRLEALSNIPGVALQWYPDSLFTDASLPVQYLSPTITTHLAVLATDSNGCSAVDRLVVNLLKPRKVFIPNAFSPNGDGNNDVFLIFAGPDVNSIKDFLIFDRWGNQVFGRQAFQPNDPTFGWDGNFKGRPMNTDVYTFFATIEFTDGWVQIFEGDVTLLR